MMDFDDEDDKGKILADLPGDPLEEEDTFDEDDVPTTNDLESEGSDWQ